MSITNTQSFFNFSALPAELRIPIWEEALCVRSVWAVAPRQTPDQEFFTMRFVGPAAYFPGQTCREARALMELRFQQVSWANNPGVGHWVDLDTTVVDLGEARGALAVVKAFAPADLAKFKHVAVHWDSSHKLDDRSSHIGGIFGVLKHLRKVTPCHMFFLRQTWGPLPVSRHRLTPEMAANYIKLLEYNGPELKAPYGSARSFSKTELRRTGIDNYFRDYRMPPSVKIYLLNSPERPDENWMQKRWYLPGDERVCG